MSNIFYLLIIYVYELFIIAIFYQMLLIVCLCVFLKFDLLWFGTEGSKFTEEHVMVLF